MTAGEDDLTAAGSRLLDLAAGPGRGGWPEGDGWGWLYRGFERVAPREGRLRHSVCGYFRPRAWERRSRGRLYRLLGVRGFGRVIPTGGVAVRRLTGWKMAAYTLRGTSLGAARDFYYRTCVFEALHLPFFLALMGLALRQLALGRPSLAIEDTVVNLVFNVYPIMHHRRTRGRIVDLLEVAGK